MFEKQEQNDTKLHALWNITFKSNLQWLFPKEQWRLFMWFEL